MFNSPLFGTTRISRYQKGKTNLDLVEQEIVSGSGIIWAMCKSAPRPRQITTPAPHHLVFYRPDALPATHPTASKHWRYHYLHTWYRVVQLKWSQLTTLLVTFECVGKIQWFLADVNCLQQEVQDHPNGIIHQAVGWPHVWFNESDILTPQVHDGVPSRVTLLHSCAEVRAAIELSFRMVSGVRHSCVRWGSTCLKWKGGFWGHLPPLAQWFQCRVDRMWRHLAC